MNFRIPKQSDRELVAALGRIAAAIPHRRFEIRVNQTHLTNGEVRVDASGAPEKQQAVQYIVQAEARLLKQINLVERSVEHTALYVRRTENPLEGDLVEIGNDLLNRLPENERPDFYVRLLGAAQRELRTNDFELTLGGTGQTPISQYLESQRQILAALQSTTQKLLVDAARRNDEFEAARQKKYEAMEVEFREKAEKERERLATEKQRLDDEFSVRQKALQTKVDAFNTKEARYVARQKQDAQIEDLKKWLEKWHLTPGTVEKRGRVELAYVLGMLIALVLTGLATWQTFTLLDKAGDISKVSPWQWTGMTLKSVLPLGLFATLLTYYIRWNGSWARQHAEEEFRNRARLIDIGRAGWLLEAVRDAQDNKQTLPDELLKQLSRNLFAVGTSPDADLHPKAIGELLAEGMKSFSVTTSAEGQKIDVRRK